MWRSENNLWGSVVSFQGISPGTELRSSGTLAPWHPMSHLISAEVWCKLNNELNSENKQTNKNTSSGDLDTNEFK